MKNSFTKILGILTLSFFFSLPGLTAETGILPGAEYFTMKIKQNDKNPVKSGIAHMSFKRKGDLVQVIGKYEIKKKWYVPVPKKDKMTDREMPAEIMDLDQLEEKVHFMRRTGKSITLKRDWGKMTLLPEEKVNGIDNCIPILMTYKKDKVTIWIHPTQFIQNGDISSPVFVKIKANATLPILGKYLFELDLIQINGKDI